MNRGLVLIGLYSSFAESSVGDGCKDVKPGYFMLMKGWVSYLDQMVVVDGLDENHGAKNSVTYYVTVEDLPGPLAVAGNMALRVRNFFSMSSFLNRPRTFSVHCSKLVNMQWDSKVEAARAALRSSTDDYAKLLEASIALEKIEAQYAMILSRFGVQTGDERVLMRSLTASEKRFEKVQDILTANDVANAQKDETCVPNAEEMQDAKALQEDADIQRIASNIEKLRSPQKVSLVGEIVMVGGANAKPIRYIVSKDPSGKGDEPTIELYPIKERTFFSRFMSPPRPEPERHAMKDIIRNANSEITNVHAVYAKGATQVLKNAIYLIDSAKDESGNFLRKDRIYPQHPCLENLAALQPGVKVVLVGATGPFRHINAGYKGGDPVGYIVKNKKEGEFDVEVEISKPITWTEMGASLVNMGRNIGRRAKAAWQFSKVAFGTGMAATMAIIAAWAIYYVLTLLHVFSAVGFFYSAAAYVASSAPGAASTVGSTFSAAVGVTAATAGALVVGLGVLGVVGYRYYSPVKQCPRTEAQACAVIPACLAFPPDFARTPAAKDKYLIDKVGEKMASLHGVTGKLTNALTGSWSPFGSVQPEK